MKSLKSLSIFLSFILILNFLGCGASKEIKPEPPPVVKSDKMEYKMNTGDKIVYKTVNEIKQLVTMMGQEQAITINASQYYYVTSLGAAPNGGYKIEFYADSLKIDADNPQISGMLGDVSFMAKKKSSAILAKNGAVTSVTEIDKVEIPEKLKSLAGQFNPSTAFTKFLLVIPEKDLKVGDTWTEAKNDTIDNMGGKMNVKSDITYTVSAVVDYKGYSTHKIISSIKMTYAGEGAQMGQKFKMSGTGKADAEYYFAKKEGKLIGYKVDQTTDLNAEITGMNMTIPMTTIMTSTVDLVK